MIELEPSPVAQNGPDLTALIDIVFIVIVFLLVTANAPLLTLPLDLPTTDSHVGAASSDTPLTIAVTTQPTGWRLGEAHFNDWASLREQLLALPDRQRALRVMADRDAPVQHLVQLLALLHEQQFSNLQLVMEQQ